jgi:hypothetical protein
MERARAMAALRGTVTGFAIHNDSDSDSHAEPTEPGAVLVVEDDHATSVYLRPIVGHPVDEARRIDACARRFRERLGRVRPALARLRQMLPGPYEVARRVDLAFGVADVERALAHARRSYRALAVELADLEAEGRELTLRAKAAGGGPVEH